MPPYRHRQTRLWALLVFIPVTAALSTLSLWDAADRTSIAVSVAVGVILAAFCIAMFCTFTVEVTDRDVAVWFLLGVPKQTIPRIEIVRAERVRLPWHLGLWGSRYMVSAMKDGIATYMVWPGTGDGVALTLRDGKRVQIGTDDADGLLKVLKTPRAP